MIKRGSDAILFDCGEGAQQQMMRARTGFGISGIFITHWHADHFLGIFGLIETLSFTGREEPITIYGPAWVEEFVGIIRSLSRCNIRFPIRHEELRPGSVVPFEGYTVRAFATRHGVASLGYILQEDDRPGRFNREHAIELGVPPGPLFGRLQRGETVRVATGETFVEVTPADVMGTPRAGRKIVYTGDTRPLQYRPDDPLCRAMRDADLLIHDATFDDEATGRADEVFHSTAGEAGEAASALNVRTLALTHISSRYTGIANHIRDAKKVYSGEVIAPADLTMLEIPFGS
jgi:ribonuclease Z